MKAKESKTEYKVQSVEKAMELLEFLAGNPGHHPLQKLSQQVDLSRNKTFRLLATLCATGFVEKDLEKGTYQVGVLSVTLAHKVLNGSSLTAFARPVMEGLARRHDEAVYMTVIRDGDVVFLDMVDCDQQVKAAPFIGKRVPFFTNAAGKVMKALDSWELLEKLVKKRGTGAVNYQKLEEELEEIRAKGVAVDTGGLGEGIISVAVAVRDYAGKVVGAITMLGPSFRMLGDRLENEIIPSMREAAELVSAKFGYAPALVH